MFASTQLVVRAPLDSCSGPLDGSMEHRLNARTRHLVRIA